MTTINYLELIDGIPFPATKVEIVAYAEDQGASEEALEAFEALPGDEYNNIAAVGKDIGLIAEEPGSRNNLFGSRA